MNKREGDSFLSRVYYLTDRAAATKYTHASIFEVFGSLHTWFPIRSEVVPYREFIRERRHFLVYGTIDAPEDWLLPKLMDDGARVRFLGEMHRGYKDATVFDVQLPVLNAGVAP
jgi:hypothetical protein